MKISTFFVNIEEKPCGVLRTACDHTLIGRVDDDNAIRLTFAFPDGYDGCPLIVHFSHEDSFTDIPVPDDGIVLTQLQTQHEYLDVTPRFEGPGYRKSSSTWRFVFGDIPNGLKPDPAAYLRLYDSGGLALYDSDGKALYVKKGVA